MSNGLFQHLPGAHEMSSANGLSSEPWLLPISDRGAASDPVTAEALLESVRKSSRRFWLGANVLAAVLALALTAHVATGWRGNAPGGPQVAEATPPTIAVEKASLSH